MLKWIPNILTLGRLVLTIVFLVMILLAPPYNTGNGSADNDYPPRSEPVREPAGYRSLDTALQPADTGGKRGSSPAKAKVGSERLENHRHPVTIKPMPETGIN